MGRRRFSGEGGDGLRSKRGVLFYRCAEPGAVDRAGAADTEQLGYSVLWYPEALGNESFALGSFLLAHTQNLIIASGIANIYARDATATKRGQHSLAKTVRWSVLLGLGVSHVTRAQ